MKKYLQISGYCPTQNKDYSISVEYLQSTQNQYLKGVGTCKFSKGKNLACVDNCPILKEAPANA